MKLGEPACQQAVITEACDDSRARRRHTMADSPLDDHPSERAVRAMSRHWVKQCSSSGKQRQHSSAQARRERRRGLTAMPCLMWTGLLDGVISGESQAVLRVVWSQTEDAGRKSRCWSASEREPALSACQMQVQCSIAQLPTAGAPVTRYDSVTSQAPLNLPHSCRITPQKARALKWPSAGGAWIGFNSGLLDACRSQPKSMRWYWNRPVSSAASC